MNVIQPKLEELLQQSKESTVFDILIIIEEGSDFNSLGLDNLRILSPTIASAELTAPQICKLAGSEHIVAIELNQEMHTL